MTEIKELVERDIYEVANQLKGYVGPSTPDDLAKFLFREGDEAAKLADRIVDLSSQVEALKAERTNLIETKREQIARLTAERVEAELAEEEAKDCFWAIYPDWCEMKGHGISTEAARTILVDRASAAEARVAVLEEALRKIDEAWASALSGRAAYERITGWTGSNDNPAQIFAWVARQALGE